jgi:uncharacterized protein (TIGR04255 family)
VPLELPEPDRRPLGRSPLQQAVCQIRYEALPRATEARVALAVHDRMGGRQGPFRRMEPLQGVQISLGPQPLPTPAPTGWRFLSDTGDWTGTLLSDHLALETTAYDSWDGTFRERLFGLIEAVSSELEPATVRRAGLRYVNRITDPPVESPQEWERYFPQELLGLVRHQHLGPGVTAAQQQVDLNATDAISVTLRHGFYRDAQRAQALTYVLDIDTYRDGYYPWDVQELKDLTDELNELSLQVFQQTVNSEMLDYLRHSDA